MAIIIGLVFGILLFWSFSGAEANSCVACHQTLADPSHVKHSFLEWEQSIHARNNVTCNYCHGGDPSKAEKKEAHAGVWNSNNPKSRVYFQTIPKTCGTCHEQYQEFQKSRHYLMLQKTGKGPNCATCHGTMATKVLSLKEMQQTCAMCHSKPYQAYEALAVVRKTALSVTLLKDALGVARQAGAPVAAAEAELGRAQAELREAKQAWHTFHMKEVFDKGISAYEHAQAAKNELDRLKATKSAP
jgi:formate-dependent nitrite reductase cytochrome c552 subunit